MATTLRGLDGLQEFVEAHHKANQPEEAPVSLQVERSGARLVGHNQDSGTTLFPAVAREQPFYLNGVNPFTGCAGLVEAPGGVLSEQRLRRVSRKVLTVDTLEDNGWIVVSGLTPDPEMNPWGHTVVLEDRFGHPLIPPAGETFPVDLPRQYWDEGRCLTGWRQLQSVCEGHAAWRNDRQAVRVPKDMEPYFVQVPYGQDGPLRDSWTMHRSWIGLRDLARQVMADEPRVNVVRSREGKDNFLLYVSDETSQSRWIGRGGNFAKWAAEAIDARHLTVLVCDNR